ncbi:hypothetical protein MSBRW_2113 [Methanosarcina barkeri str. Wiesmoor]|uniref:Uncharacterized protein n=2 Tax=Methanosarcina barkeri TaxID=2208 RepID=A0A0E3LLJ2_METBA|nr:hypothetical protein [Methanosarcina barkeri]AKB51366.1 hypothetical protein MSBRW_2113 [Methanosarcina barkeri str. Wiesmoor]
MKLLIVGKAIDYCWKFTYWDYMVIAFLNSGLSPVADDRLFRKNELQDANSKEEIFITTGAQRVTNTPSFKDCLIIIGSNKKC